MKKIPSGYRLSGASQERHGGSIYCSSWSDDFYECDSPPSFPFTTSTGDKINVKNEESSSESYQTNMKTVLVRCMATCGGNHVTIYEVGAPCDMSSTTAMTVKNTAVDVISDEGTAGIDNIPTASLSSSSGLRVRQTYCDADEEEVFYTCAFGGRSAGTDFGYQPKDNYDKPTNSMKHPTHNDSDDAKKIESTDGDTSDDGDSSDDAYTLRKRSRGKFNTKKWKRPRMATIDTTKTETESPSRNFKTTIDTTATTTDISNDTALLSNNNKNAKNLINLKNYNGPQLCCVAGKKAIIKVIDTTQRRLLLTLIGHGDEIYDLKFSPIDPWLLISASKDESLRLWNLQTATCVIMFAGHEGHSDSVLCAAWHPLGRSILSSGMDTTVKIWSLEEKDVQCAIKDSYLVKPKSRGRLHHHNGIYTINGSGKGSNIKRQEPKHDDDNHGRQNFRTLCQQLPIFSSSKMHTDYVDCVQFVGDLVLSKSITNTISLWKPDLATLLPVTTIDSPSSSTHHHHQYTNAAAQVLSLRDFDLTNCDIWFVRFQANEDCTMLASGNCIGEIRVWEIGGSSYHPCRKHICTLTHPLCTSTVRMVSFSPPPPPNIEGDDSHNNSKRWWGTHQCIIATCDDGTVWKWDAK